MPPCNCVASWLSCRRGSVGHEDGPRDVADATVELDGIVAAVEVGDGEQPTRLDLDDAGVAEIPTSHVVAQHDLGAPATAAIRADAGADAERREAVAGDTDDASVRRPRWRTYRSRKCRGHRAGTERKPGCDRRARRAGAHRNVGSRRTARAPGDRLRPTRLQ